MLVFNQEITGLARDLIGARLLVRGVGGTVIETEAYGRDDPASHSFRGPTPRNAPMFGPPGTVYVYLSYGSHLCLNVVGRPGEAVLIRALRPEIGVEVMQVRRNGATHLAAGPGRLGQALAVSMADNGRRFGGEGLLLLPGVPVADVLTGPRIGITRAADRPWRFGMPGVAGLSRPFPTVRGTRSPARCFPWTQDCPETPMPNEPRPAAAKRTPPVDRQNAQGDHEGSPHRPEEFKKANRAVQGPKPVIPDPDTAD